MKLVKNETIRVRDVDDMIYGEHCETVVSER